jgi:hypothetical protein
MTEQLLPNRRMKKRTRLRKLAVAVLPQRLASYHRRQLAAALCAKRPQRSRWERHLDNVAEREAALAAREAERREFESLKPQIEL